MFHQTELSDIALQARTKLFGMLDDSVTALVTTNAVHVGYLGGYRSILWDADRTYRCALIATRDGVYLVTGASDAAAAMEVVRDPSRIYRYGQFYVEGAEEARSYEAMPPSQPAFTDALAAACAAAIGRDATVALDVPDAETRAQIGTMLDGCRLFNATPKLVACRATKLPGELAKLRVASAITERGMQRALAEAREGMTELDLSAIISGEIIAAGGIPRFVVVTTGGRSALVDAYATSTPIRKGDLLRIDVGCTVNGYWADTARTAVCGEPSDLQASRYDALLKGELAQLDMLRPGVSSADLYNVAIDVVRQGALPAYRRNHCGHGIGLVAHEYPSLAPSNPVEIVKDMVLCVETPYYEIGWGGMMVEDTVIVTETGIEYLTHADRSLRSF